MPDRATPATEAAEPRPLLVPGHTCWRREPADRAAFLIDAEAYFAVLADAIEAARHRVMLLGWDFHSRVRLRRGTPDPEAQELAALLDAAVRRRRGLRIYVLEWDFAMLYWPERESHRAYRFATRTHRRVRFAFDANHPVGASHHQKVAVIDDAVAFAGGIDVTSNRWDTREHRAGHPHRTTPDGQGYAPFHDVQMAVDGGAAAALGELARERWRRATGRRLGPVGASSDPWPRALEPHLREVEVGIARTDPGDGERPPVAEVESLYRESIAAARRSIYIENQYLTADGIAEALARRLAEPEGPEVVIVVPSCCDGWLEEKTMGVLRDRVVRRLREADRHDRLRVLQPRIPGLGPDESLTVHAKVMVVDDRLARVGSANLSNRSMGLDTECDLAIEARSEAHRHAIARFRDELLGEHLGESPERVAEAREREGSLAKAVDGLRGNDRSLELATAASGEWSRELAERLRVFDPEAPLRMEELLPRLGLPTSSSSGASPVRRVLALVAAGLLALAAWRFTPLAEVVDLDTLASLGEALRSQPGGRVLAAFGIGVASLVLVPVTALLVAASLVFPPATAFGVALAGSLLGALAGWLAGRVLWRDAVRRLAGARFDRLGRALARRGVLASLAVQLLPIAPFGLVNLVAGASHVRLRDFLVGTGLAMAPGILALVLVSDRVARAVAEPDGTTLAVALAAVGVAVGALLAAGPLGRRLLAPRTASSQAGPREATS